MSHTLIIGGGVIGLMTALELADAGLAVTLVEMGDTGQQSSWAGGGILSPLYPWRYPNAVNALAAWSQAVYPALCTRLFEATGVDPEFQRCGLLVLDPEEHAAARAWAETADMPVEVVDRARLADLEPGLQTTVPTALWFPDIGQVRNPRLTRALRLAIDRRVQVREREEVLELLVTDGRVTGVRTGSGPIEADRVVVCTGAWTAQLLAQLGERPEIRPLRGQMLLFCANPGQIHHLTLFRERYVIPRKDGRVLIGSTLEDTGFDKRTTAEAKEELYRIAVDLFPLLRRTPIEDHWAGLRPASPGGIPYIGPHPAAAGLYVNAGHFRNGLVTGPASARLLADLLLGREPILPASNYALGAGRG